MLARRLLFSCLRRSLLVFALLATATWAHSELLFAFSEGASGAGSVATDRQMAAKYQILIEALENALEEPVRIKYVRDFDQLSQGMENGDFDLVMARPADYPARGVRDHGYHAILTRNVGVQCVLVVPEASPLQSLEDLGDLSQIRIILPEQASYMAAFCAAELRDHGLQLDPKRTYHVREQAAIPFAVKNGLVQVAGIGSGANIFKDLDKEGLRVLHRSREQPFLPLIAHRRMSPGQIERLRAALTDLATAPGSARQLAALGMRGFNTDPEPSLLAMLQWLSAPQSTTVQ